MACLVVLLCLPAFLPGNAMCIIRVVTSTGFLVPLDLKRLLNVLDTNNLTDKCLGFNAWFQCLVTTLQLFFI
jgi:hypothetical protein